jgi:hypothetical protein
MLWTVGQYYIDYRIEHYKKSDFGGVEVEIAWATCVEPRTKRLARGAEPYSRTL